MATPKTKSPIPLPDFLNVDKELVPRQRKRKKDKHQDAYEEFCKWSATPKELREPKTQAEFASLWKLAPKYISNWKNNEDFQAKRLNYFWNWMFEKLPDVMYAIYRRAKRNSSADARIFTDIIGKRLETNAPKKEMTPFLMVGIPQDRVNNLFVPKGYDSAIKKTIELNKDKVEDAETMPVEKA